jgi:hypothetical protein
MIVGAKGSGKRAALAAVAQGKYRLVERSMYDYTTFPELRELFDSLSQPCVLCLRHFEDALGVMTWKQEA